jgi:hypothetical protein
VTSTPSSTRSRPPSGPSSFTLYRLGDVLDGDLDELLDHVITYYQTEKLKDATADDTRRAEEAAGRVAS